MKKINGDSLEVALARGNFDRLTPIYPKEKLRLEREKFELEKAETLERLRLDAWKAQTDAQRKAFETQSKIALARQKTEGELALKAMGMSMERDLDETRLRMGEKGSGLTKIKGVGGW